MLHCAARPVSERRRANQRAAFRKLPFMARAAAAAPYKTRRRDAQPPSRPRSVREHRPLAFAVPPPPPVTPPPGKAPLVGPRACRAGGTPGSRRVQCPDSLLGPGCAPLHRALPATAVGAGTAKGLSERGCSLGWREGRRAAGPLNGRGGVAGQVGAGDSVIGCACAPALDPRPGQPEGVGSPRREGSCVHLPRHRLPGCGRRAPGRLALFEQVRGGAGTQWGGGGGLASCRTTGPPQTSVCLLW